MSSLSSALPGVIARPPESPATSAAARRSSRSPPFCFSGPWHFQQGPQQRSHIAGEIGGIGAAGRDGGQRGDGQAEVGCLTSHGKLARLEGLTGDHPPLPRERPDPPRFCRENDISFHSLCWWLHQPSRHSGQNFMDHVSVHIRKAEVAARVAVRQLLVVETQQVQERGVQVVDVDIVLHGLEAELVGGAVDLSALDAAAGQPDREAVGVVIASVDLPGSPNSARPSACGRTRRPRGPASRQGGRAAPGP